MRLFYLEDHLDLDGMPIGSPGHADGGARVLARSLAGTPGP